jgi:hypothetical protein
MRELDFIRFFFESYFPSQKQIFINNVELIYVQKNVKDGISTCWINVVNQHYVHFVLGVGQSKKDFKSAFVNALDQVMSIGIDTLLNQVLNPFSESEAWRVFKIPAETIQHKIAIGEIIYHKKLV